MTKKITIELRDWIGQIHLDETEALTLLKWFEWNNESGVKFYEDDNREKPWMIGRVFLPERIERTEFWDDPSGRKIADKYHIEREPDTFYFFTLEDFNNLKEELNANPYWKQWNDAWQRVDYSIGLKVVKANDCL